MKTYVFKSKGKKNFTVNERLSPRLPALTKFRRIAKFVDGEFRTKDKKIFLKLKKKFPYRVEYDSKVENYNAIHRSRLVKMAAERGIPDVITKKKKWLVKALEAQDAKGGNKE